MSDLCWAGCRSRWQNLLGRSDSGPVPDDKISPLSYGWQTEFKKLVDELRVRVLLPA